MTNIHITAEDQALALRALKGLLAAPFVIAGMILSAAWSTAILGIVILGPFLILGWLFG